MTEKEENSLTILILLVYGTIIYYAVQGNWLASVLLAIWAGLLVTTIVAIIYSLLVKPRKD